MQEKNSSNSNSLGFCQRLFNFFIKNLVARDVNHLRLGQQESFGSSAKPKGEVILVRHQDHENSNDDLGMGSEIRVHFKQSEELEAWTPVDKFADHNQMLKVDGIQDKATEKGKEKVRDQETPRRKKERPLRLEKIVQPRSKNSPNLTPSVQSRSANQTVSTEKSEEGKRIKDKGKSIPNGNLTLPIQYEEVPMTPRRFFGSPSINQRSETFIKIKKEEMRKYL